MSTPVFKSVNLQLDISEPSRFAHYHPTGKSMHVIRAVLDPQPTSAAMIVAAYGSGKSLAAGIASMITENLPESRELLTNLQKIILGIDKDIGSQINRRLVNGSRGIAIVMEGYQPNLYASILHQAKSKLQRFRGPRQQKEDLIQLLRSIHDKARLQGFDRITLVWDEFGRHLETLTVTGRAESLSDVQQIAEWSVRQSAPSSTFVVMLHRNFSHYAGNLDQIARQNWRKIEGRFNSIRFIENSKEFYQLLASTVAKRRQVSGIPSRENIQTIAEEALENGFFSEIGDRGDVEKLIEDAYPIQPVVFSLLPLLASILAQNERTAISYVLSTEIDNEKTFQDLYKFFSEFMASDVGIGGSHRKWLETESALSKVSTNVEKELICATALLGIGHSGERKRVRKQTLLFAVSGFVSPILRNLEAVADSLIERKLLIHRQRTDDISVWHGTDVDIRQHLDQEVTRIREHTDFIEELIKEHPVPAYRPVMHNVRNSIRRFFAGRYVFAEDILGEEFTHSALELSPGEDGRIIYCIAESESQIPRLLEFALEFTRIQPGILFSIPKKPVKLRQLVLEVVALRNISTNFDLLASDPFLLPEIEQMIKSAQEVLTRSLRRVITPSSDAHWCSRGSDLGSKISRGGANGFLKNCLKLPISGFQKHRESTMNLWCVNSFLGRCSTLGRSLSLEFLSGLDSNT